MLLQLGLLIIFATVIFNVPHVQFPTRLESVSNSLVSTVAVNLL